MTAGVQAAAGCAASARGVSYSATIIDRGSGNYSYSNTEGSPGSLTPSSFDGVTIDAVYTNSSFDFGITLDGTVAQDVFTSVLVQKTDGGWSRFYSADATFTAGAFATLWSWSGSDPAWTSAGTRAFIIYY